MEISHNPKADVMYIEFSDKAVSRTKVLSNGLVVVDLDENGMVVGIELISPSLYVDDLKKIAYVLTDEPKAIERPEA